MKNPKPMIELIDSVFWMQLISGPWTGSKDNVFTVREDLLQWVRGQQMSLVYLVQWAAHTMHPVHSAKTAELEMGRVLAHGSAKHGYGWREPRRWSGHIGAALRHLAAYERGEIIDAEGGTHHLANFMCRLMFLEVMKRDGIGTDDRHILCGNT